MTTTSEKIDALSAALVKFHKEVKPIHKASANPFFNTSYASLSDILAVISQPLADNGLAVIQSPHGEFELTTRIIHESGQWIEDSYKMEPVKKNPQGQGSAIQYQKRYAIAGMLNLHIDDGEDDDGDGSSGVSHVPERSAEYEDLTQPQQIYVEDAIATIAKTTTVEELATIGETFRGKDKIVRAHLVEAYTKRRTELS